MMSSCARISSEVTACSNLDGVLAGIWHWILQVHCLQYGHTHFCSLLCCPCSMCNQVLCTTWYGRQIAMRICVMQYPPEASIDSCPLPTVTDLPDSMSLQSLQLWWSYLQLVSMSTATTDRTTSVCDEATNHVYKPLHVTSRT